ncbi:hypothetical protein HZS_4268 [Henneguya salminicola]|nr:hypothetical protein HZS_4268 [Henneguya salminicola]
MAKLKSQLGHLPPADVVLVHIETKEIPNDGYFWLKFPIRTENTLLSTIHMTLFNYKTLRTSCRTTFSGLQGHHWRNLECPEAQPTKITWFQKSRFSFKDSIFIIYFWVRKYTPSQAAFGLGLYKL